MALTAVAFGIVLTLMTREDASALVPLVYPIVALFLTLGWAQNDVRIGEIGQFIARRIGPQLPGIAWEGWLDEDRKASSQTKSFLIVRFSEAYALGIFVGSELFMVVIARPWEFSTTPTGLLLAADICAILGTWFAVRRRSSHFKKNILESIDPQRGAGT